MSKNYSSLTNLFTYRQNEKPNISWKIQFNSTVRDWKNNSPNFIPTGYSSANSRIGTAFKPGFLENEREPNQADTTSPIERSMLPSISLKGFYESQKYPLQAANRLPISVPKPRENTEKNSLKLESVHYEDEISKRSITLPPTIFTKTVIFDLDETLIHCSRIIDKNDTVLSIKLPNSSIIRIGVKIRPYALQILQELSQAFEIIIFTASNKCYADPILDLLDPEHKLISYRLYRDRCISKEKLKLKDLRIFSNRNLKDLIIIDNSLSSFSQQMDNGILIPSWYGDPSDRELLRISHYLKSIISVRDVREHNRRTFKLFCKSKF